MTESKPSHKRIAPVLLAVALVGVLSGACIFKTKKKVSVAPVLTPLEKADLGRLFEEINRASAVRSLRGRIDVQFLDTSFAECGVVDKYRTADGDVVLQRPGKIYLAIKAPFGVKIAEMTSDGTSFWVAVYQGDERYQRFVHGTNEANYARIAAEGASPKCGDDGNKKGEQNQRTVSSLSGLRPQHLTDALMPRPAAADGSNFIYAMSESFEEEPDTREGAKKGARVVRGYYVLVELEPTVAGRARVTRRFWFDRFGVIRLARVQNYDAEGQLITDVVYRDPKPFGAEGRYRLPSAVEVTRPQDRYSLRITFQSPEDATVDKDFNPDIFVLKNTSNLPEVDLDKQKGSE